jgi:hypothetical protein
MLNKWHTAKAKLSSAQKYVSMIGKKQNTSRDARGYVHSVGVKTQVYYQERDGAKNYHTCDDFDRALSEVIKKNWDGLAEQALIELERKVAESGKNARADVEALLEEIDGYKA